MLGLFARGLLGLNGYRRNIHQVGVTVLLLNLFFASFPAIAEFGDVVMNKQADIQGVRPVIFSHTFHRIRFRCKVCHTEVGFKMRAGSNDVTMFAITDGKFCGACHNGNIAWGPENCNLCHSGRKGLKNGVVGGHETRGPGIW